jgi:thiol-disulfide isomerase/thioredoxin
MRRPPVLPTLDWPAVFASALTWESWLETAEKPEHRDLLRQARKDLLLEESAGSRLAGLSRKVHVLAIAETWCGDVRRHAPVLQRLADGADRVEVRFVARADAPEVFKRYRTNGGEAIPKFVFFNDRFVETGNWGPMSRAARLLIARGKAAGLYPEARKRVAERYAEDPGRCEETSEILAEIEIAAATEL